jgi:phosphoglycolate phosphatase
VKLLLFDVDLTLISTGGAGIRALNRACRQLLDIENAMDGITPSGKTDPGIVREIFAASCLDHRDPGCFSPIIDLYLTFLREEVENTTQYRVLPGVLPLLERVSSRSDVLLGLATGNVEPGARIKLERGKLNGYFEFGGFGSDSENRTELVRHAAQCAEFRVGRRIAPSDVFVIGDTPLDIDAGRQAGFRTVGVATGKFSVDELNSCGATLAIADLEQGCGQFLRTTFIE